MALLDGRMNPNAEHERAEQRILGRAVGRGDQPFGLMPPPCGMGDLAHGAGDLPQRTAWHPPHANHPDSAPKACRAGPARVDSMLAATN